MLAGASLTVIVTQNVTMRVVSGHRAQPAKQTNSFALLTLPLTSVARHPHSSQITA
jgi:hypothetical protein